MLVNHALLEASAVTRHFMTKQERQTKKALCRLLIDKGHRKYAERFWRFDFNIVSSKEQPDFTAAISFDDATVYISDGFLGSGEGVFSQLDVLLRHELAHNLMMHQIRMMTVLKQKYANNPDEAWEHIKLSMSLHELFNWIEDFEISNTRYTEKDKLIVKHMTLNGRVIGGLLTEEHRTSWAKMPLEDMYAKLSAELAQINTKIRNDPDWAPRSDDNPDPFKYDALSAKGKSVINKYRNTSKASSIRCPIDIFVKSKTFKQFGEFYKNIVAALLTAFKDRTSDAEIAKLTDLIQSIAMTGPEEQFDITDPLTGEFMITLYTPEEKMLANDVLKNMTGNINYDPLTFNIKRKTNAKSYKDAWNAVMKVLDKKKFDDKTLSDIMAAIEARNGGATD